MGLSRHASNIDFNLTYLAVTILAEQGSRPPKRRLNQRYAAGGDSGFRCSRHAEPTNEARLMRLVP